MSCTSEQGEFERVPIVIVASATWASPLRLNVHHVAERLAARGHRVLFVESTGLRVPSIGRSGHDRDRVLRRLADLFRGVREVRPGLHVSSPAALPGARAGWLRRLSLRALAWQVGRAARELGMKAPVLWAFLPTASQSIDALGPRLVVYHCVDHYAANPGVDAGWVDALEARMLERADLVLATSSTLAERLGQRRDDVHLIQNVADVDRFQRAALEPPEEPEALRSLGRPRAIYAGNLAHYRIDVGWLEALARALPKLEIVLVGPAGLGESNTFSFDAIPNVHLLGAVPAEDLPAFLAAADVGLIPFLDNAHTRSSFPLKFWEYVAAGLPVVSRDLPSLAATASGLDGVRLASDCEGFVAGVRAAVDSMPWDRALLSAGATGRGWENRIDELEKLLAEALAKKPES